MKNKMNSSQIAFIKNVGKRVKELRNQQNISQIKLSLKISDHYSLISKVELGKNITLSTLIQICNALNTKPSIFFKKFI